MRIVAHAAVCDLPDLNVKRGDTLFYAQAWKQGVQVPVLYVPVTVDHMRVAMLTMAGLLHPISDEDLLRNKPGWVPPDMPATPQPIATVRRTRGHLSLVEATSPVRSRRKKAGGA